MDKKGNISGTTAFGGHYGNGIVFRITPDGRETVRYVFSGGDVNCDAGFPNAVIMDKRGNLYGTTFEGGLYDGGTIFQITRSGREVILYDFYENADEYPAGTLVQGDFGTFYGTTSGGGGGAGGAVFEFALDGGFVDLHGFSGNDGLRPYAGLIIGASKDFKLYGTTAYGGAYGYGTVFEVTADGIETVLHDFAGGSDGAYPYSDLTEKGGYLYGTTTAGGAAGLGTIFSVKK